MAATYEIDFQRLRDDATRGGFNPLTIVEAGGMSAYLVERPEAPTAVATPVPGLPTQGGHFTSGVSYGKVGGKGGAKGAGGGSRINLKAQAARAAAGQKAGRPLNGTKPNWKAGVAALAPTKGGGGVAMGGAVNAPARQLRDMPVVDGVSGPWREHPSDFKPNVTREQMEFLLPVKPPSPGNPGREMPMGAFPWESNPYFPSGQSIEDEYGEGELSPATPILWVKTLADLRWNVDRLRSWAVDTYVAPTITQFRQPARPASFYDDPALYMWQR